MHLYQDNLHLLHSGKRILLNNFILNLNFLAEHQVCNINYLASKKENSEFHIQNLKNFDAGNLRSNNDFINLAHLNPLYQIRKLRIKNSEKVIIENLNINSLPNKFDQLKETFEICRCLSTN